MASIVVRPSLWNQAKKIPIRYPMAFGVILSGFKTSFSDLLVQKVVERREKVDWRRNAAFAAFGFVYLGGVQYTLYVPVFGRLFPSAASFAAKPLAQKLTDVKGMFQLVAQTFLDQCVHHPLMYFPAFYMTKELVMADKPDIMKVLGNYRQNMKEDLLALWKIWVPATLFNFAFMPMHLRIPFVAGVSLLWTCVLSAMRGGDVAHSQDMAGGAVTGASYLLLQEGLDAFNTTPVELDDAMYHVNISAVAKQRPGLVALLSRHVAEEGGNVTHSKMVRLGEEFIIQMHVAVPPEKATKFLKALKKKELAREFNIQTTKLTKRCSSKNSVFGMRLHCVGLDKPGMVARVAEKAASLGLSIENMTTTLRIGKDGKREFVIDAMVSSPNMADYDNLDSMIHDMSSLKTDLELSHFDVFVHAGKHNIPTTTPNNDGDDDKTELQEYYNADETLLSEQRQTANLILPKTVTTNMAPHNNTLQDITMLPEEDTLAPFNGNTNNDKLVLTASSDEEFDALGEVSLTPTGSNDEQDNQSPSNGEHVVDPWAQAKATTPKEGEDSGTPTDNEQTSGGRWDNFRSRWQTKWQNNRLQDEQVAVVERPPPKEEPSTTEMTEETTANTTPPVSRFSRFISRKPATAPAAPTPATTLDPGKLSAEQMASFRASRISVTLQKESRDSKWGFGMEQHKEQPNAVRIGVMAGMGLLEHAPFQEGDILVSINNQKCTNAESTIQELVKMEGGVPITLMVETPQGNPNLVQAMVRKPSADANLGIGFYRPADALLQPSDAQEKAKEADEKQGGDESNDELNEAESGANAVDSKKHDDMKASTNQTLPVAADDPCNNLLHINNLDANGLLAHSALSQGDIVVAINATPCSQLTPEEAQALLCQSDDTVTIIAMKPPANTGPPTTRAQRWLRQAKRAGIALGGGTMVGVGLIFIPTLPPPFGEVLIVGGVSVLGTEFEAPKRVMRSARDSLERAVGREEPQLSNGETKDPLEASETGSTAASTDGEGEGAVEGELETKAATPPKITMGDRFKNFGRKVVLPFLDQVVGDRKEEEGKEGSSAGKKEEETTTSETPSNETPADDSSPVAVAPGEDVLGKTAETKPTTTVLLP